jgi:hypothetical protein
MTEYVESDISMKRYLLGELAEPEQQALEERLMTSDEYFDQLLIAEDDLVDEYLRGTLSAREKERFNGHFLCTPERRHKLNFSRSLQRYVATHAETQRRTVWGWPGFPNLQRLPHRILEWSLAAALSLIVLGGGWLTYRIQGLEQLFEQARSQPMIPAGQPQDWQQQLTQLRGRNDQLVRELQHQEQQQAALQEELNALKASTPQRSLSAMMAFALIPDQVRGMHGRQKVAPPAGASWVQLQLDLGMGEYKRYQAVLQKAEGEEIWSQNTPKVKVGKDSEMVVLTLPAGLLRRGYYILKLSGMDARGSFEEVAKYYFRVVQK